MASTGRLYPSDSTLLVHDETVSLSSVNQEGGSCAPLRLSFDVRMPVE